MHLWLVGPGWERVSEPPRMTAKSKFTEDHNSMSTFSVNTNITSLEAQTALGNTELSLQKTIRQLTTGLRINSSQDDAAGLAVANRETLDDTGLQMGVQSANDAISTLQTQDGAMSNISSLLDRAMSLATQAASDTFQGNRATLNNEF